MRICTCDGCGIVIESYRSNRLNIHTANGGMHYYDYCWPCVEKIEDAIKRNAFLLDDKESVHVTR